MMICGIILFLPLAMGYYCNGPTPYSSSSLLSPSSQPSLVCPLHLTVNGPASGFCSIPDFVHQIKINLCDGGGGGSSCLRNQTYFDCGGGGSGACFINWMYNLSLPSPRFLNYSIGKGGLGGKPTLESTARNGGTGENSRVSISTLNSVYTFLAYGGGGSISNLGDSFGGGGGGSDGPAIGPYGGIGNGENDQGLNVTGGSGNPLPQDGITFVNGSSIFASGAGGGGIYLDESFNGDSVYKYKGGLSQAFSSFFLGGSGASGFSDGIDVVHRPFSLVKGVGGCSDIGIACNGGSGYFSYELL